MDAEDPIREYLNKVWEIPLLTPTQETWRCVQVAAWGTLKTLCKEVAPEETLEATRFGVNRERVRQIEAEALHILLEGHKDDASRF